jgi:hypothetical protein
MLPVLRRIGIAFGAVIALLGLSAVTLVGIRSRDRNPEYAVDLRVTAGEPAPLQAGFAAVSITPEVPDTWSDLDGDARRSPDEPFEDGNGNGRFDPVWLAGFHNGRAATGVHDDLWARAIVVDDGRTAIGLVVLDAIGLMHDQVVEVRRRLPADLGLTYAIVASTHSHQAPDLMGLWGERLGASGIDPAYLEQVLDGAARALTEAAQARQPAVLRLSQVPAAASPLVTDSRPPHVLDPGLRMLQAVSAEKGEALGVLVTWGNHPETLWSHNLEVSSDFPHFLREGLEHGVRRGELLVTPGLGGVAVFASGAIGGLMTTDPDHPVKDPITGEVYKKPTFEKARAQGTHLAQLAMEALRSPDVVLVTEASIALRARTIEVPLDNVGVFAAAALGGFPRGFSRWAHLRSEVAAFRVGPASFLMVPGEIYPEIVNGGIEAPPGRDFLIDPVELPPLRKLMPGRFRFVVGLANDELGYIIPQSQWDDEPPWLYDAPEETYGEVVSMGPETGPLLHAALREILEGL